MKSYIQSLLIAIFAIGFTACSSDNEFEEIQDPNKAKVTFVYTLDTSNSGTMSRATTNEEVFNEFYAKITSGELVAPSYSLTLTEVNTGVVYTFNGNWNSHDLITLNTGTYSVVGTSTVDGDNIQEKCSFTFDEQIEIRATSNVITLHANYDCFLLIFNDSQISLLQNYNGTTISSFFNYNNYKYAFVNNKLYNDAKKSSAYILGKYTDNAEFKIFTSNLNFEKGKYYVYNSVSNGFDVPPMENGSVTNREIEGFGRVADAVDLGLSVKWASWNVGASKIADYGGLYGAGDPTGQLTSTSYKDYHYYDIIYNSICGTEYDLATIKWQEDWRLPTFEELKELKEECSWEHDVTLDGVIGSIATGPNGNSIFIPYAGVRNGSSNLYKKNHASLWSGEKGNANPAILYSYSYKDLDVCFGNEFLRLDGCECYVGQSIRPVCE